jgi:transcriptional regulator with XRE-family HTH domain
MDFQCALDKTLLACGISGSRLAAEIGCGRSHISQLRRDGGECTLAFQARLLDALDRLGAKQTFIALWQNQDGSILSSEKAITFLKGQELSDAEVAELLSVASEALRKPAANALPVNQFAEVA